MYEHSMAQYRAMRILVVETISMLDSRCRCDLDQGRHHHPNSTEQGQRGPPSRTYDKTTVPREGKKDKEKAKMKGSALTRCVTRRTRALTGSTRPAQHQNFNSGQFC